MRKIYRFSNCNIFTVVYSFCGGGVGLVLGLSEVGGGYSCSVGLWGSLTYSGLGGLLSPPTPRAWSLCGIVTSAVLSISPARVCHSVMPHTLS